LATFVCWLFYYYYGCCCCCCWTYESRNTITQINIRRWDKFSRRQSELATEIPIIITDRSGARGAALHNEKVINFGIFFSIYIQSGDLSTGGVSVFPSNWAVDCRLSLLAACLHARNASNNFLYFVVICTAPEIWELAGCSGNRSYFKPKMDVIREVLMGLDSERPFIDQPEKSRSFLAHISQCYLKLMFLRNIYNHI